MTAVAVQTSLFEHGRTFVQCCTVAMYSTFVSYCTLHSTNCIQFRNVTQNQFYLAVTSVQFEQFVEFVQFVLFVLLYSTNVNIKLFSQYRCY